LDLTGSVATIYNKKIYLRNFTRRRSLSDEAFFDLMTERLNEKVAIFVLLI
jgi:hypothetical protein